MAEKKDIIKKALEEVSEAAKALSLHGAGGYTVDTSALDVVFIRSLVKLNESFEDYDNGNAELYDPYGDIQLRLGAF